MKIYLAWGKLVLHRKKPGFFLLRGNQNFYRSRNFSVIIFSTIRIFHIHGHTRKRKFVLRSWNIDDLPNLLFQSYKIILWTIWTMKESIKHILLQQNAKVKKIAQMLFPSFLHPTTKLHIASMIQKWYRTKLLSQFLLLFRLQSIDRSIVAFPLSRFSLVNICKQGARREEEEKDIHRI